eukprot:11980579-Alexandrium_andersonii.AAC.1
MQHTHSNRGSGGASGMQRTHSNRKRAPRNTLAATAAAEDAQQGCGTQQGLRVQASAMQHTHSKRKRAPCNSTHGSRSGGTQRGL